MKIDSRLNSISRINVAISVFFICAAIFVFVRPGLAAKEQPDGLAEIQKQARSYRAQGLQSQGAGDIDTAMSMYQKAVQLDPYYAPAYNDLGVIYEGLGLVDSAEENYLRALQIDPNYLSAYTNLALLYEDKRDLEKAAFYWSKRAELGTLDDSRTQKAITRLRDIRAVLSPRPLSDLREQDVLELMKDVCVYKTTLGQDDLAMAGEHFSRAKDYYKRGKNAAAIKEALDAQYLDPKNEEIETFIEQTRTRELLR